MVDVTFHPTAPGTRTGSLYIQDNASSSPQIVALSGVGVGPTATLSATNLVFATQVLNTISNAKIVTLTNRGNAVLNINGIAVSGDFTQTNSCIPAGSTSGTIAPGGQCSINVRFKPSAINNRTGSITITDNANPAKQTLSLSGTGTQIKLSPTRINFPTEPLGTKSAPVTITVTNVGSTTVTISGIAITGQNPGDFARSTTCIPIGSTSGTIAGGGTCTISVTFKPTGVGTRTANVSVSDNGGGSPQRVASTGIGTTAKLSPTSLKFGSFVVGTASAAKAVTLTNVGTTALTISSILITGANAADFSQTHNCGNTLAIGASCQINVTFKPTAAGTRNAALSISDNAAGSPQRVSLSGTGI